MKKLSVSRLIGVNGGAAPISPCTIALIYVVVSAANNDFNGLVDATIMANTYCP